MIKANGVKVNKSCLNFYVWVPGAEHVRSPDFTMPLRRKVGEQIMPELRKYVPEVVPAHVQVPDTHDMDDEDDEVPAPKRPYSYATVMATCKFKNLLKPGATLTESLEAALDLLLALSPDGGLDEDTLTSARLAFV